jgi:hypothetical protein
MLKIDREELDRFEKSYPGIKESILRFENAKLPACPHCGSEDTADVQCGVIGRTMHIAVATTKFRLLMGAKPGEYCCNACNQFFDQEHSNNKGKRDDVKPIKERKTGKVPKLSVPGGFLSRPEDKSLAAYKRWIQESVSALGGSKSNLTEKQWREHWKEFWSD